MFADPPKQGIPTTIFTTYMYFRHRHHQTSRLIVEAQKSVQINIAPKAALALLVEAVAPTHPALMMMLGTGRRLGLDLEMDAQL